MNKPESVLEDKVLWDLEMQTDHSITASRQDLMLINKKKTKC